MPSSDRSVVFALSPVAGRTAIWKRFGGSMENTRNGIMMTRTLLIWAMILCSYSAHFCLSLRRSARTNGADDDDDRQDDCHYFINVREHNVNRELRAVSKSGVTPSLNDFQKMVRRK